MSRVSQRRVGVELAGVSVVIGDRADPLQSLVRRPLQSMRCGGVSILPGLT